MLEITKENYEGYTKLAEIKLNGPLAMDEKFAKKFVKFELAMFILYIILLLFKITLGVFLPAVALVIPTVQLYIKYNKKLKKLKEEYKNIDSEISKNELVEALQKVNILSYEKDNKEIIPVLNKNNFLEYLENKKNKQQVINQCEQIKSDVINKYDIHDSYVTENELEKVKQKIKVLTK